MIQWLRSGLWWVPLAFSVFVAGVGTYAYRALETSTREALRGSLETILQADVTALHQWVEGQRNAARAIARDRELWHATAALLETWREGGDLVERLGAHPERHRVLEIVGPEAEIHRYQTYGVLAHDGTILVSPRHELVGHRFPAPPALLERVMNGETLVTRPARVLDAHGKPAASGAVVLYAITPLTDETGQPRALLGLASNARGDFSEVLQTARMGHSGETYAFDDQGLLLSGSRFEDELVLLGMIEQEGDAILRVEVRDPGGNRLEGFVPTLPERARPLTRMAASAIASGAGHDIDGYPDYRGVSVVGAWTWVEELGLGITTEIDFDEAYAGLTTVRRSFAALAVVLVLSAVGMLAYSLILGRMQHRYEQARKLGRYEIERKIGEGGMGTVYLARHALLRRPTALKLLSPEHATEEAVTRFEREVQAIASLTHPNTIAVFDYGRTPDRTFYYAMEFLDGITLRDLVETDGAQSEARVMHILKQAAGSLSEAHASGLIHRDLKPANIMLCVRGGLLDFVKVLDFGLVRGEKEDLQLTSAQVLTGTPQYLSPEALQAPETVDTPSDVYQLGAVAYLLLTGRPVFHGETLVELLGQHLHAEPLRPSEATGYPLSPDLEELVLTCLRKDPTLRPKDGKELLRALEACDTTGTWDQDAAGRWWDAWSEVHEVPGHPTASSGSTLPSGWHVDLAGRTRGS